MSASILTLTQRVVRRLPLTSVPEQVVGSNDPGTQQLLEMFQQEGDELRSKAEWARLILTWTVTIVSNLQDESFPADYDRLRTRADIWRSGSNLLPLIGPVPPDEWHRLITLPAGFPGYWRPYGAGLTFFGIPVAETTSAEYVSSYWIMDVDGVTTKPEFTADTDTSLLPDQLLMAGVLWRWKSSKGLEYAEDMATYERMLERFIAADRLARPIPTARNLGFPFPTWPGRVVV